MEIPVGEQAAATGLREQFVVDVPLLGATFHL